MRIRSGCARKQQHGTNADTCLVLQPCQCGLALLGGGPGLGHQAATHHRLVRPAKTPPIEI